MSIVVFVNLYVPGEFLRRLRKWIGIAEAFYCNQTTRNELGREYRNILFIFCFDKKSVSGKHNFCQNRPRIYLKSGNIMFFGQKSLFY